MILQPKAMSAHEHWWRSVEMKEDDVNNPSFEPAIDMRIHIPGDNTGESAQGCRALLDSGSKHSITFRKIVCELGYEPYLYQREHRRIETISGQQLTVIGNVRIRWNVLGYPNIYLVEFVVLEDRDSGEPTFDFLLGRDWIGESKAFIRNTDAIPAYFHKFFAASQAYELAN